MLIIEQWVLTSFRLRFYFSQFQGLSKEIGGPGLIFVSGALFFPKMLASGGGGGGEQIFSSSGQIPVTTSVKSFFWINICKILV
jgi:hypothetical protein